MSMVAARCAVVAALLLTIPGLVPAPVPARQVPQDDDDAVIREAMVRRSLEENCLICHTDDMIAGQRLTSAQWKAEVDKMIGWGAPLPKEAAGPLVEYLAQRYSDREAPPVPSRSRLKDVGSLEVPSEGREPIPAAGDLARGERLHTANCGPATARRRSAATWARPWSARRSWTTRASTTGSSTRASAGCPGSA